MALWSVWQVLMVERFCLEEEPKEEKDYQFHPILDQKDNDLSIIL